MKEITPILAIDDSQVLGAATIDELYLENQRLREELALLKRLAYRDTLTGLRNRNYFNDRIVEEVCQVQRSLYVFSLLYVDVNDLKAINDDDGHAAGDRMLCWVAQLLQNNVRQCDIVCRVGGDEFIVLLPGADRKARVCLTCRLRDQLSFSSFDQAVGLSIGGATCPDNAATVEKLLAAADRSMYRDKRRQKHNRDRTARSEKKIQ